MASDDGFREIQLDGKQLVFLFMATTIVAVVIFLCGVMVGRGVRNGPATVAIESASGAPPPAEAVEPAGAPGPATAAANAPAAPPATPPAPPAEDSSYYSQLGGGKPPAGAPKQTPTPVVEQPAAEPPLVVQVAAMLEKNQAEAIVKRLVAKGYPAYLVEPPATGGMFRVRVGKFNERREAEAVLRRLVKEEQFKQAWIPR
jgi:cell division septation protein DedD